jgi:hypothetical protein
LAGKAWRDVVRPGESWLGVVRQAKSRNSVRGGTTREAYDQDVNSLRLTWENVMKIAIRGIAALVVALAAVLTLVPSASAVMPHGVGSVVHVQVMPHA